ncbi:kinase-like domain-containing protein [Spinellus fusiger]|nr:kinase-like domain-containing protein [Spinellus fusiger]
MAAVYKSKSKFSSSTDRLCGQLRDQQQKRDQLAAQSFLETTLELHLDSEDLHKELQDGILLCEVINRIHPGAVTTIGRKNLPFIKMNNIGLFLQAAHELGLQSSELFQTVDLYEAKDMIAVVNTILTLARFNAKQNPPKDNLMNRFHSTQSNKVSPTHTSVQPIRAKRSNDVRKVFITSPASPFLPLPPLLSTSPPLPSLSPPPSSLQKQTDTFMSTLQQFTLSPSKNSQYIPDSGYNSLSRPPSLIFDSPVSLDDMGAIKTPGTRARIVKQQSSPALKTPSHFHSRRRLSKKQSSPLLKTPMTADPSLYPAPSRSTPMSTLSRHTPHPKTSQSIQTKATLSQVSLASSNYLKQNNVKIVMQKENGAIGTHYQLGNCIGKGQFGTVYRALDMQTGESVAIKRIKVENVDVNHEIMLEVELLKSMASSSIVQYIGFVRDEEHLNIVLEYAENGSLLSTLKAFGSLPEKLVASFTHKILNGLAYLHAHDVVHCDLKAANILTTKTGDVKLTDFGVSFNLRLKQDDADILAGTPYWMAPEVIVLEGASAKSDIWSLGCTIIELLTGKPPYANLISMSALYHIVEDDHPPLPTTVSKPLRDFLMACFRKDPLDRPSAKQLLKHPWMIPFAKLHPPRPSPNVNKGSHTGPYRSYTYPELLLPPKKTPDTEMESVASVSPAKNHSDSTTDTLKVPAEKAPIKHQFIKTTFETAIICKICLIPVKKNAVCCIACAMICHAKCRMNIAWCCSLPSPQIEVSSNALPPNKPNKFQKMVANIKKVNKSSNDLLSLQEPVPPAPGEQSTSTGSTFSTMLNEQETESRRWWERFV